MSFTRSPLSQGLLLMALLLSFSTHAQTQKSLNILSWIYADQASRQAFFSQRSINTELGINPSIGLHITDNSQLNFGLLYAKQRLFSEAIVSGQWYGTREVQDEYGPTISWQVIQPVFNRFIIGNSLNFHATFSEQKRFRKINVNSQPYTELDRFRSHIRLLLSNELLVGVFLDKQKSHSLTLNLPVARLYQVWTRERVDPRESYSSQFNAEQFYSGALTINYRYLLSQTD